MEEIWIPVVGFEGLYEVSSLGRVRSLDRVGKNGENSYSLYKGRILNPAKGGIGYFYVHLSKDNIKTNKYIHRLVAEAFLKNPDNLPQVNHKDENKLNNCVENLEWCTAKYNIEYSGNVKKMVKVRAEQMKKSVIQYTKNGEFVSEYKSIKDAEIKTGICGSAISRCCLKRKRFVTAGGYKWSYKDSD